MGCLTFLAAPELLYAILRVAYFLACFWISSLRALRRFSLSGGEMITFFSSVRNSRYF